MEGISGIVHGEQMTLGAKDAILDHRISGSVVRAIRVNGVEMPELGLNATIAGYFGVPVILVSGDTAVCRQTSEILGKDVMTVAVKEAYGRLGAKLVSTEGSPSDDQGRGQGRAGKARTGQAVQDRTVLPFRARLSRLGPDRHGGDAGPSQAAGRPDAHLYSGRLSRAVSDVKGVDLDRPGALKSYLLFFFNDPPCILAVAKTSALLYADLPAKEQCALAS
jgi:hypothetical protein